jgi:hypothetical protein
MKGWKELSKESFGTGDNLGKVRNFGWKFCDESSIK